MLTRASGHDEIHQRPHRAHPLEHRAAGHREYREQQAALQAHPRQHRVAAIRGRRAQPAEVIER